MAASGPHFVRPLAVLATALIALAAGPAPAQILPWEVTVAEIEAGHLRGLCERLSKQNLLYQFHLGEVRKSDLIETAGRIDRIIETLEKGNPSQSVPAPWTAEIAAQIRRVDGAWGPLRRIAVASPYEFIRVRREYAPTRDNRGDPLRVYYFDDLSRNLISESEKLLGLYNAECEKTGLGICPTAYSSGDAAMLIERVTKQAVNIVAGIEPKQSRQRLEDTIEAYHALRRAINESDFYAEALNPERGVSARAAGQLLASLREDWDALQVEVSILSAGDEQNFDLQRMLNIQVRLVAKVERLTAALLRFASLTYGS